MNRWNILGYMLGAIVGAIAISTFANVYESHSLVIDHHAAAKQLYCAKSQGAVDDLRAGLHDTGRLDGRTRVAGAAALVVLAARYCSGLELPDLANALVYDTADLDAELARLSAAFPGEP
jgi:hypothetical protein